MIREWGAARMAALIGVVSLLAIPATATAATYCVHSGGTCPPGEIDQGSSLQSALTAANGTGVADQVKVGAGSYVGPFTYLGAGGAVQITGVGASTILTAATGNGVTVLNVSDGGSRVESLHIDVPLGNSSSANFGLVLNGGTADGVSAQIPAGPTGNVVGVSLLGATFRNGTVLGPMPASAPSVSIDGIDSSGDSLIEDSIVHIDHALGPVGGGTLRRLDLQGRVGGQVQAETFNGGTGNFVIEDVLWRSQPGAADDFVVGLLIGCGNSVNLQATVRNLTLIDNAAMGTPLAAVCNVAGRSTNIDVSSSIMLGGNRLVSSTGAMTAGSTLNLAYSDFDPAKLMPLSNGVINQGPGNVNATPGFGGVDDFHLAPGSSLIDVGDPAGLAPGESAADLGGSARIVRGLVGGCPLGPARRDIGAYEAPQAPAPPCTPTTTKKCKKHKKKHKRSGGAAKKKKCKKHKKKH
jgi:hypothetical protein